MIFLQIANDSLKIAKEVIPFDNPISEENFSWLLVIEIIVLAIFVLYQFMIFFKTKKNIQNLESTFNDTISIKLDSSETPYLYSKSVNNILSQIKKAINQYLKKNFGSSVNFSIIQDIIDREIDLEDEGIQQSISIPLYLGLAATMSGIILGLWAMPNISSSEFTNSISTLINGVKWAMTASLSGLSLTTILSIVIYKPAMRNLLHDKNKIISMLQADLLPELVKADETGFSGLKTSLERFSRQAETIVHSVGKVVNNTKENILAQNYLLDKIEKLDVQKVSRANLNLFNKLDANIGSLENLYEHLSQIEQISYNLREFSKQTEDMNAIGKAIKENVDTASVHTGFLHTHFDKLEKLGEFSLKTIGLSDAHFRDALDALSEEIKSRISTLNNISNKTEASMLDVFNKLEAKMEGAIPNFKGLKHLDALPEIKKAMHNNVAVEKEQISKLSKIIDSFNLLAKSMNTKPNVKKDRRQRTEVGGKKEVFNIEKTKEKRISTSFENNESPFKIIYRRIFKK